MPNKKISDLLTSLEKDTNDLFSSTYYSNGLNNQLFSQVSDELTTSIQTAIKSDSNYADMSNTTRLYEKLFSNTDGGMGSQSSIIGQKGELTDIMNLFNDADMVSNLMNTYANTRWIKMLDEEIDLCVKHMPKLQTALNILKDNVLCADSFQKSFINVKMKNSSNAVDEKFASNAKYIMSTYKFEQKAEQWFETASKYGETFVYCVPYKKALSELLKRKKDTRFSVTESVILENGKLGSEFKPSIRSEIKEDGYAAGAGIYLSMNRTCLLEEPINAVFESDKKMKEAMYRSVYTEMLLEATNGNKSSTSIAFDKSIGDELTYDDDSTSADGLIGKGRQEKNPTIKTRGSVLKTLDRGLTIPIYLDEDFCLGYYYFKLSQTIDEENMSANTTNSYSSMSSMFSMGDTAQTNNGDLMLRHISQKISQSIDATFINANQDLKEEIYMMLKYNDTFNQVANSVNVNVTFIPPEDIIHIKFNEDPKTHRGRSDLWNGLIAAKMWIMLNSTSVIGTVTRGQDKRVYYVKTMVETNVAKTLLNVVGQIKKGNFGIRQIESVNNILGMIGKFNDFVIPVGPSGDSPVTMDVLQGQTFELPQELMTNLEESAINPVVPLEIVNSSTQMDYAIRYTMTNGRLMRTIIARQAECSEYYSKIFTKLYNCEFDDNAQIEVTLPPPTFLMVTQGAQMIQNTVQYIDTSADVEMAGRDDEDRNLYRQKMLHRFLPGYIDLDMIKAVKDEIDMEKSIKKSQDAISGDEQ